MLLSLASIQGISKKQPTTTQKGICNQRYNYTRSSLKGKRLLAPVLCITAHNASTFSP